jgi:hypothetical protein
VDNTGEASAVADYPTMHLSGYSKIHWISKLLAGAYKGFSSHLRGFA